MIDWKSPQFFPTLSSTQTYLLKQVPPLLNTIVYVHHQTGGRGTHGRLWTSVPGDLLFSFSFEHALSEAQVMMIFTLSVIHTVNAPLQIKPPNDLLWKAKKCGGLLIQQTPTKSGMRSTLGAGVNLTPPANPTFSSVESPFTIDVLISRFKRLFNVYAQIDESRLFNEYQALIDWNHLRVTYRDTPVYVNQLLPNFICETDQGPIPMAHLSFEII